MLPSTLRLGLVPLLSLGCVAGPATEGRELRLGEDGLGTLERPITLVFRTMDDCHAEGLALFEAASIEEPVLDGQTAWVAPGVEGCFTLSEEAPSTAGAAGVVPLALVAIGVAAVPLSPRLAPLLPRLAPVLPRVQTALAAAAATIYVAVSGPETLRRAQAALQGWRVSWMQDAATRAVESTIDRAQAAAAERARTGSCLRLGIRGSVPEAPQNALHIGLSATAFGFSLDEPVPFQIATVTVCQNGFDIVALPTAIAAYPGAVVATVLANWGETAITFATPTGTVVIPRRGATVAMLTTPLQPGASSPNVLSAPRALPRTVHLLATGLLGD